MSQRGFMRWVVVAGLCLALPRQAVASERAQETPTATDPKTEKGAVRQLRAALRDAEQRVARLTRDQQQSKEALARLQAEHAKLTEELKRLRRSTRMAEQVVAEANQELAALRKEQLKAKRKAPEADRSKTAVKPTPVVGSAAAAAPAAKNATEATKAELEARYGRLYRDLQTEHRALQQRLTDTEATHRQRAAELQAQVQRLQGLNTQLTRDVQAARDTSGDTGRLQQKLEGLEQAHREEVAGLKAELKRSQDAQFQLTQELESKREKLAEAGSTATTAQERTASLERSRGELLKVNAMLEDELNERSTQLAQFHKQLLEVERVHDATKAQVLESQQALKGKQQALEQAQQRLLEARGVHDSLEDQLRVAEQTQVRLGDEVQGLQKVRAERDQLKADLHVKEMQIIRMQGELERLRRERADYDEAKSSLRERKTQAEELQHEIDRLTRDLISLRSSLQQAQNDLHEREQEALVERRGYQLQIDRLERELQAARSAREDVVQQLVAERERVIIGEPAPAAPTPAIPPSSGERSRPAPPPSPGLERSAAPPSPATEEVVSPERYPVKIHQIDGVLGVMVLSRDGIEWATEGTQLVLSAENDAQVATVQLTELDREGFAVVQVTQRMVPIEQIRKGDVLFAHPLLKPTPD